MFVVEKGGALRRYLGSDRKHQGGHLGVGASQDLAASHLWDGAETGRDAQGEQVRVQDFYPVQVNLRRDASGSYFGIWKAAAKPRVRGPSSPGRESKSSSFSRRSGKLASGGLKFDEANGAAYELQESQYAR